MSSTSMTPNHREIIAAQSEVTGFEEYLKSHNGALIIYQGGGALPTTPIVGQATQSGSATQLASNTLTVGVIIQALSTNVASIYVGLTGVTSSTGYELQPGQATSIVIDNTNKLYIVGTSGDKVCYMGS